MAGWRTALFFGVAMLPTVTATWQTAAGQAQSSVSRTYKSAEVAQALERFHGQPLILVFAPGLWGGYCKQAAEFAAHGTSLHSRHVQVAWLLSHDAGQKACDFSNSVNDVELKVGTNNGSALPVFHFFNAPENAFTVILLDSAGTTIVRSSKPVLWNDIRTHLNAPKQ
jgi:hypothetical protein